jgi:hypothetical protein
MTTVFLRPTPLWNDSETDVYSLRVCINLGYGVGYLGIRRVLIAALERTGDCRRTLRVFGFAIISNSRCENVLRLGWREKPNANALR